VLTPQSDLTEGPFATRDIVLGTHSVTVCGLESDGYFTTIDRSRGNDFLVDMVSRRVSPDAQIVDIGANIGVTTLLFAKSAPQGKVLCIEPSRTARRCLEATIRANDAQNCRVHAGALGAGPGSFQFRDDPNSASASHLVDAGTLGSSDYTVEVVSLDNLVETEGLQPTFIKIDVEGFEGSVLDGASETLGRFRPDVFIEFNSFTLLAYGNINPRAFAEHLVRMFPFVYYRYHGELTLLNDTSMLYFIHTNLIENGCVDDLFCTSTPL
jgi:FkbM family methyltransferase